jgi:two-component system response regulator HydG
MVRLLVIDGDRDSTRTLTALLSDGFSVADYGRGTLAVDAVRQHDPDVVFLAGRLPDASPDAVLAAIADLPVAPPVVLVADTKNAPAIAKTIRTGAFSYITKPYVRRDVLEVVEEAINETAPRRVAAGVVDHPAVSQIVGESPAIARLKEHVFKYADADSPVLIQGESGTGKDLVARALHGASSRSEAEFIPVNCGAIPLTLFESEVFGSERGAYTGAVTRPGCFEQAHRGTLFLDEIGEMVIHAQVKLLRVLEDGLVTRIGSTRAIRVDTRVIAATNSNLREAMEEKRFRDDLYYRLNVLGLKVPALRDRMEDIPLLVESFLRADSAGKTISTPAIRKLLLHSWPGNVRELRNVVKRAAFLAAGRRITASDIVLV